MKNLLVIVISLIEYGDSKSAINLLLRMRIHQIQEYLGLITDLKTIKTKPILNSLIDSVPAIRSLLICYDPMHLSQNILIKYLQTIEKLVNDYWNNHAIQYYMKTIRSKVNYLPDNLKFIANNNGIIGENNIEQISNILLNAQWLVIDDNHKIIYAMVGGIIQSISVYINDKIIVDQTILCTIQVMKTEITIISDYNGKLYHIYIKSNQLINTDDPLFIIKLDQ
ncbi:unnamed protein product [Rotaria sordida]|uniref:Lipoyl-binding domain-containing protein n=1 Tax=Rotaria sordida TaxID=392033 RepID=A0A819I0B0_9BILA|nr:unnamed protein product [Rotaria sordida]